MSSILEQLDEAEKAAIRGHVHLRSSLSSEAIYIHGEEQQSLGVINNRPEADLYYFMRNNIRALIDIAKAAERLSEKLFPAYLRISEEFDIPEVPEWKQLKEALAKLEGEK